MKDCYVNALYKKQQAQLPTSTETVLKSIVSRSLKSEQGLIVVKLPGILLCYLRGLFGCFPTMDRFSWVSSNRQLQAGEHHVILQHGIRIYDGENKTNFDCGNLILTSHFLIWEDEEQQDRRISLSLALVSKIEEHAAGFMKSAKLLVHLLASPPNKEPGPFGSSSFNYIKLSFRRGGHSEFHNMVKQELQKQSWLQGKEKPTAPSRVHRRGPGIIGIERNLEEKSRATDKTITQAFKDLDALMEKAKEMVALADKFASKLEEKKGGITEDELSESDLSSLLEQKDAENTKKATKVALNLFREYLHEKRLSEAEILTSKVNFAKVLEKFHPEARGNLSRKPGNSETHGSGTAYHKELAKELEVFLRKPLEDSDGMMTLTDVYCRFNRARGMELVSPEDLVNASKQFESLNLPLRLRPFDSGVLVIQSSSHNDERVIKDTEEKLRANECLTGDELAKILGISVMLAKERLLVTEKAGKACRDDSVEGLKFYPNLFLQSR